MNPDNNNAGKEVSDSPELKSAMLAYAKKIFPLLLKRCENKDVAFRVIKELLTDMFRAVKTTGIDDPLEAMLFCRARHLQDDVLGQCISKDIDSILRDIAPPEAVSKPTPREELRRPAGNSAVPSGPKAAEKGQPAFEAKEPCPDASPAPRCDSEAVGAAETVQGKGVGFLSIFLVVFLVMGILSMLWIMAGLAMDYGFLPKLDLGYEWFSMNIAPWF